MHIGRITPRSAREIVSSDWSIGCETLDRDMADYAKYKRFLGPLGAKAVRLQGGWAKTEKQPGVYDWKWLDEIIDDALSQGVQPWVELSYGNPAYEGGGGTTLGDGLPTSGAALAAWDAWAKTFVQRYKDRVSTWEIWNEPDVTREVPAAGYADLFIRSAEIIRAVQPGAKLCALALANNVGFADAFLSILAAQGKLGLVDIITFHGYPHNPDDLDAYTKIQEVVARYPAKIELRQGETGAPSGITVGAQRLHAWTELSQAKWVLRCLLAHHGHGVPMSLFTFSDIAYRPDTAHNSSMTPGLNTKGLLAMNEDQSISHAKPSYFAAQNVFSIFDHSVVLEKNFAFSSNSEKPLAVYGYRKLPSGDSVVALWFNGAPAFETNDFTPVDITFKSARFENPVCVDLRTGRVSGIPDGAWSKKGDEVRFSALPVYDSPTLIAEKTAFLFG